MTDLSETHYAAFLAVMPLEGFDGYGFDPVNRLFLRKDKWACIGNARQGDDCLSDFLRMIEGDRISLQSIPDRDIANLGLSRDGDRFVFPFQLNMLMPIICS